MRNGSRRSVVTGLRAYTSVVSHIGQEAFLQVSHSAVTADLMLVWVLILSDKIAML